MPLTTPAQQALIREPITLGKVTLPNRVFVAPHTTNFGEAGVNLITSRHLDYHRARARGGAGLIITEGIRVHPTSLRRLGLHAFSDEALPGLTALAETVHAEGAKLFAQLLHTGRHSGDEHAGQWGASATPWTTAANVPHVMNAFDIDTVIRGFADAARRVVAAGFDGMEVHLGHGHLLQQFLSPITNDRDDAYGGSPERRLRLAREVVAAVRAAVGDRAAVGLRVSADEFVPGGLDLDDVVGIVRAIHAETPVDFVHVSHSAYIGAPSLSTQMADMSYGTAPFRHLPARFKQEFPDLPVLAICRIDTIATGAEMLAGGEADLVGFARAHIAEPNLLRRSVDTAADAPAPRRCIACNQGCNANLEAITPITCTVNPAVGREREWDAAAASIATRRRVVVVGGGPAGLEAATSAARRGHAVTLLERGDALGGQLRDVVLMDHRDGFTVLRDQLLAELATTDVEVRLGVAADAALIAGLAPDVVVLATGATAGGSPLAETLPVAVLDSVDVLRDPAIAGTDVMIVDELGAWEAAGLARHLAARGARVELVSPTAAWASRVTVYSRLALGFDLDLDGITVRTMLRPATDADGRLELVPSIGGERLPRPDTTSVVHVRPRRADAGLLDDLLATGWAGELHLVGDAFAPRTSQEAIAEGRATGLAIGVADPAVAAGIRLRPAYRLPRRADTPLTDDRGAA